MFSLRTNIELFILHLGGKLVQPFTLHICIMTLHLFFWQTRNFLNYLVTKVALLDTIELCHSRIAYVI